MFIRYNKVNLNLRRPRVAEGIHCSLPHKLYNILYTCHTRHDVVMCGVTPRRDVCRMRYVIWRGMPHVINHVIAFVNHLRHDVIGVHSSQVWLRERTEPNAAEFLNVLNVKWASKWLIWQHQGYTTWVFIISDRFVILNICVLGIYVKRRPTDCHWSRPIHLRLISLKFSRIASYDHQEYW